MLTDTTSSTSHPSTSPRLPPVSTDRLLEHGTRLLSQLLSIPTCQSLQSRVGSIDCDTLSPASACDSGVLSAIRLLIPWILAVKTPGTPISSPSATCPSYGTRSLSRIPPTSPVKVVLQARVRPVALDRPMPLPS
jgi:hypothetical protein